MIISWTRFEIFERCPLWHSWSFIAPDIKEPSFSFQKDVQHLARGNATQAIVDQWARDAWYQKTNPELMGLLDQNLDQAVEKALSDLRLIGESKASAWEIKMEILPNLQLVLPELNLFYKNLGSLSSIEVQLEQSYRFSPDLELMAVLDMVVTNSYGQGVILEGKATRKPKNTKEDQLRWQIDILGASREISDSHYYVFYATGQFWVVSRASSIHQGWKLHKEVALARLLSGDSDPTPGPFQCAICPHNYKCPHKYLPKKRVAPLVDNLPSGRSKIVFLDDE